MSKWENRSYFSVLLILALCCIAQGGPPQLIRDIYEPVVSIGSVYSFTAANGLTFMGGTSIEEGSELWISDGTTEGTHLQKDIFPGIENSSPTDLIEMNGICFFSARDGINGRELWKSDGTLEGTTMVMDIYPGQASSEPDHLFVMDGTLYFAANDGVHGKELWRSDGTTEGTWMVKDINPDGDGRYYAYYQDVMGDRLFFCGRDSVGVGLWVTDGTEAGTEKLMAGACSYITAAGTRVFFSCNGELYWSDGTVGGSGLLKDINPSGSSYPKYFTVVGNTLFFTAADSYGNELWKVNPATGAALMVKDMYSDSSSSYPEELVNINGTLYFAGKSSGYSKYLWKSDGTTAGTIPISPASSCYAPSDMIWYQSKVFFVAGHTTYGYELYSYDPLANTLDVLSDVMPDNPGPLGLSPYNLTLSNDTLFFTVQHSLVSDRKLYVSDGTSAGTQAIETFWQSNNGGSNPFGFTEFDDMVYFCARTSDHGYELWKTNCMDITEMVKDIFPDAGNGISTSRSPLYPFENFMLFRAYDGTGNNLWKTDGTEVGTVKVHAVNPYMSNQSLTQPQDFIPFQDEIYFSGYESQQDAGIWKTDGTTDGTVQVHPMWNPTELVQSGELLYFSNYDPNHGSELWKSDGTTAGTELVKDIATGTGGTSGAGNGSYPYDIRAVQNKVVFRAEEQLRIPKLWVSDGTEVGTFILKDFRPGERFSGYMIGLYNNELYFIVNDGIDAVALWKTDGTQAGTQKIKGIDVASDYGILYAPVIVFDDILYFACYDSVHGVEMWRTDGTEAGTYILKEFAPGTDGISLNALKLINKLLFIDINVQGQSQQWISDGTENGTTQLTELAGFPSGDFKTNPTYLNVIRNTLIFAGNHNVYNSEPMFYRMDIGDTNLDNIVNLIDFQALAQNWLSSTSISNHWGQYSDITDYGYINLLDLAKICESWGNQ